MKTFEQALKIVGSDMTLAARIKIGMAMKGINDADLVRRMAKRGLSNRQTVYKWLRGETKKIEPEHLFWLAEELEMDPEWLATKKGEPHRVGRVSLEHKRLIQLYNALPTEKERRMWERQGNVLLEESGETSKAQPFKTPTKT